MWRVDMEETFENENILENENIIIRFAKSETNAIIDSWCEIFGDTRAFVSDFYIWSGKENTLAAFCGEKIVGAVNFPTVYYKARNDTLRGGYIFASFVNPEYRNRGIFSSLVSGAEAEMRKRAYDFSFVVPANDGLFQMYEKMGYTGKVYNGFPYTAKRDVLREYTPTDDIYVLWKIYSRGKNLFSKDIEFFNHTMRDMEESGKCFAVSKDGYIVYFPRHDGFITVFDRMEGGELLDGGKRFPRALFKTFTDKNIEAPVFNMFFEPEFEVLEY